MNDLSSVYTTFEGHSRLASGPLCDVALAVKQAVGRDATAQVLTFDDRSGRVIDIDTRGSDAEVVARYALPPADENKSVEDAESGNRKSRGRGRPRLGVVGREVTLLPRHWDWLMSQPGGASVALRKLVEGARRENQDKDRARQSRDAAYRFMSSIAGDFPGFEEAIRALYAGDRAAMAENIAAWPGDIRAYAEKLAFPESA